MPKRPIKSYKEHKISRDCLFNHNVFIVNATKNVLVMILTEQYSTVYPTKVTKWKKEIKIYIVETYVYVHHTIILKYKKSFLKNPQPNKK
jgi:hypothetical protein